MTLESLGSPRNMMDGTPWHVGQRFLDGIGEALGHGFQERRRLPQVRSGAGTRTNTAP
jgi:hypothetical protein